MCLCRCSHVILSHISGYWKYLIAIIATIKAIVAIAIDALGIDIDAIGMDIDATGLRPVQPHLRLIAHNAFATHLQPLRPFATNSQTVFTICKQFATRYLQVSTFFKIVYIESLDH